MYKCGPSIMVLSHIETTKYHKVSETYHTVNDAMKQRYGLNSYTVNSRYLDFGYLESPLISKRKFGPCFNTEI